PVCPAHQHRARSARPRSTGNAAVKMPKRYSRNLCQAAHQRSGFGRRDFLGVLLSGLACAANELASPVFGLPSQVPLFREVAEEVGLKFHHVTGANGEYYVPEIMGAGVALFD